MKLSINRNTFWCDVFVHRLAELGVRYACISPGSRSTPLTLAFASNKSINLFPIVDERSSAFFALGIAKNTQSPVAVVTTSGTAVAELYPAIIEAYYQRVPLIICTADRPPALRNSGANQTINQQNIFKNHIRYFVDAGLPDLKNLNYINDLADKLILNSSLLDKGPVHINFSFEKPFEPRSYTDKIEITKIQKIFSKSSLVLNQNKQSAIDFDDLIKKFQGTVRGIILVGSNNYNKDFTKNLVQFSKTFGYPIYADGSSSLRFGSHSKEYFIDNFTAFARIKNFQKYFDPKLIIQFGGTPTSNVLLEFFKNSKAEKILVNEFGDRNDPSHSAKKIFAINPTEFCSSILKNIGRNIKRDSCWLIDLQVMNNKAAELKNELIYNAEFPFEGRIANELINSLPKKSNLMISNSLPIRDIDFFASSNNKNINIFSNRGASGIDGINSTALGIAKTSKDPTYLLIGDLAFYHDMNGLHNAIKYKIPLTVILINNNGGGIFESLPISDYKEFLLENFLTPLELDLSKLVKAYGGKFNRIKNWKEFSSVISSSKKNKKITVLEIRTNAKKSKGLRDKYWKAVSNEVDLYINEIKS
ncbi:MAG: 2-succinyl-5-enolpyruvyl-6-hydroxy-3-cyclohexene-1-carboxylic-acid synthase [Ignavibacteriales bacterium]|nr:MAG: 2-succinyl-5-enolpyruvyl-6-hydroxy-3-cyclohexene-1-carboxylic-acid synthase [Ignavibacteriales bacterium]